MATGSYPKEITHKELIELGRDWLIKPYAAMAPYGHYGCGVVLTEIVAATHLAEQPDVLGFCSMKSILIECKASRADFLRDKEKPFRVCPESGVGCQRWYLAPLGIIKKEEVPPKWGLLEVTQGRSVLPIVRPEIQERHWQSEISILTSTLRRLNIQHEGHISIKKYTPLKGVPPSKNRATFYVNHENDVTGEENENTNP